MPRQAVTVLAFVYVALLEPDCQMMFGMVVLVPHVPEPAVFVQPPANVLVGIVPVFSTVVLAGSGALPRKGAPRP